MCEEKKDSDGWAITFLIAFPAILGFHLGVWLAENYCRKEAVENGAAKWVVTDSGGHVKFEWIKK